MRQLFELAIRNVWGEGDVAEQKCSVPPVVAKKLMRRTDIAHRFRPDLLPRSSRIRQLLRFCPQQELHQDESICLLAPGCSSTRPHFPQRLYQSCTNPPDRANGCHLACSLPHPRKLPVRIAPNPGIYVSRKCETSAFNHADSADYQSIDKDWMLVLRWAVNMVDFDEIGT